MKIHEKYMGINEAKINLQFRISPRRSKMRVVKNLDQIFKDYTKEEKVQSAHLSKR